MKQEKDYRKFRNCFEFLQKVFLVLMHSFSCVLLSDFLVLSASVLRQIARYLPHHRSENASKTHPKSCLLNFALTFFPAIQSGEEANKRGRRRGTRRRELRRRREGAYNLKQKRTR